MNEMPAQTDIRRDLVGLLPQLRRFAAVLVRDANSVDPLVVRTCEAAVEKAAQPKPGQELLPWAFTLMRVLWTEETRRRKNQAERDDNGRRAEPGRMSLGKPVLDALSRSSAPVFLLCSVEGMSYAQAASIMGITPDAVAVRMLLARRELGAEDSNTSERRA
ncbi:RNA polymerase sigma-70 factor, ECF subfamily [Rhizobium sp. RU35A]|uniref:sigma factor-like helix-turn-helix DNA-binding protein n=1 Tax=Rhizobium sp. RU35A TaxID=1907414 RepID=UPI000956ED7E|nr:sigma factor-like helix-turn-helix DNA-binding protein [Rhizobium sp. RU35A]SIQ21494.1 RNA polymerase sigma-70 factor, ECF subfamily [Rhizobium sp. RU35A]